MNPDNYHTFLITPVITAFPAYLQGEECGSKKRETKEALDKGQENQHASPLDMVRVKENMIANRWTDQILLVPGLFPNSFWNPLPLQLINVRGSNSLSLMKSGYLKA